MAVTPSSGVGHSLKGSRLQQGADCVEPDLVMTKDGILVARHENEIGGTTDVSARPEFASRRVTKSIDGISITGWFTEDFKLAELKTLRAKERIPGTRPANTRFDGMFEVPTLEEVLQLVEGVNRHRGKPVCVGTPTTLVADAHARGLIVHGWTFRAENTFLPADFDSSADPNALGDLAGEVKRFLELGMDGFFTDQPDIGVRARDEFVEN